MSAQSEHYQGAMPLPEIRTVDDLRTALSRYGFPGDREKFEAELSVAIGASPTNDLEAVAMVVRAYRHRVQIRNSPAVMAALEEARPESSGV
ncbi:hypothetical protein SLUN_17050 [Streptomyces lunaelactis]|uniref:Uncharacterized protein n=1 Tax=Streptomyces lunaelactis TaxID=1535768 RepID=A0A2R4T3E0_9ACTN|nr:hypothetical protein [Streptomyces lunaelactis]AVZ73628.1 hypothetical protein SLUN_17050 [Streptomyces lunaelactis]NUK03431.1 hypothetical protein [Streptomyces lunaelactis]NUK12013.1 hypothetical protein [Streptomyces lunaelactis]NUK20517.1 hypothetical protein [Streptomyces lunaelactis]NUK27082.1 hypothetical protein [Streptomyces lunaelactis]